MVQKLRLIPDRYHLADVGPLENGNNYWIDVQLNSEGRDTRDFVATYVFDTVGELIQHKITDLGLCSDPNALPANAMVKQERERIGAKERRGIWGRPFAIQTFGLVFGLVVRDPQQGEIEGYQAVDAMPGWTLMFYPPWEDGLYNT